MSSWRWSFPSHGGSCLSISLSACFFRVQAGGVSAELRQAARRPAQVSFEDLPDVPARRPAQRVQYDVDTRHVFQERPVLVSQHTAVEALTAVTASPLALGSALCRE